MGTALNYVALRLLGVPAEHPVIVQARATLHKLGEYDGFFTLNTRFPKLTTRFRRGCCFSLLGQVLAFGLECL
jgi:hypothetical protein